MVIAPLNSVERSEDKSPKLPVMFTGAFEHLVNGCQMQDNL